MTHSNDSTTVMRRIIRIVYIFLQSYFLECFFLSVFLTSRILDLADIFSFPIICTQICTLEIAFLVTRIQNQFSTNGGSKQVLPQRFGVLHVCLKSLKSLRLRFWSATSREIRLPLVS